MTTTANSGAPRDTTAAIATGPPFESPGLATHSNASSSSRPATTQQSRNDRSLSSSTHPRASRPREGTMSAAVGRIEQGFGNWNHSSLESNTGQLPPIQPQSGQDLISRTPGVDDPSALGIMRQQPLYQQQPAQNFMPNTPSMDISSSHQQQPTQNFVAGTPSMDYSSSRRNMDPAPLNQQPSRQSLAPHTPTTDYSRSYGNTGQLPPIQQEYAQTRISDTPGTDVPSSHMNTGQPPSFHQQSRQSLAPDTPAMDHLSSYRDVGPPPLPQQQDGQTLAPHTPAIVPITLDSMGRLTLVQSAGQGFTSRSIPGMDHPSIYSNMGSYPFFWEQPGQNSQPRTPPSVLSRSPSNIRQPRPVEEQLPTFKTLNMINSMSQTSQSFDSLNPTPITSGAAGLSLPNDVLHVGGILERRAQEEDDGQEEDDEMEEDYEMDEDDGQEEEAVRQGAHEQGKDPSPWRQFLNDEY